MLNLLINIADIQSLLLVFTLHERYFYLTQTKTNKQKQTKVVQKTEFNIVFSIYFCPSRLCLINLGDAKIIIVLVYSSFDSNFFTNALFYLIHYFSGGLDIFSGDVHLACENVDSMSILDMYRIMLVSLQEIVLIHE